MSLSPEGNTSLHPHDKYPEPFVQKVQPWLGATSGRVTARRQVQKDGRQRGLCIYAAVQTISCASQPALGERPCL